MSVQKYKTNLNCGKCVATVKPWLDQEPAIDHWDVDTDHPAKTLTIEGNDVPQSRVEELVRSAGFRVLGELNSPSPEQASTEEPASPGSLGAYYPLLLVVSYLVGITLLVEARAGEFLWQRAMANFMGAFFLAFSFFKLLDVPGFASSFQMYDVVARRTTTYAYLYPFIELLLGIAYVSGAFPVATNLVTLVVMSVGLVGVAQSVLQKRQIQCACLGTVFNLPMSYITLIEDGVMAAMAATMLISMAASGG